MGNCMRETRLDHEVQTLPVEGDPPFDATTRNELSAVQRTTGAASPASSFAFQLFPDKSADLSKSLDHIAKEVSLAQLRQDGNSHSADFQKVLTHTRALEAQIEAFRGETNAGICRISTQSPGQYLRLEAELEREMSEFRTEVTGVKRDVEEINRHARDLTDEERTGEEEVTLGM
jgi:primosomal protein N''